MNCHFIKTLIVSIVFLLVLPVSALCTDYKSMTTQQLSELRGTMYNASQEQRDLFRDEWRKRINEMTPEEKQQFLGAGGGRGKGNRSSDGLGDGKGRGKGGGAAGTNDNGIGQGQGISQETGQETGQGSGRK